MSPDFPKLRPVEAFPVEMEGRRVVCLRDPEGLTDRVLMVPPELFYILTLFDGQHAVPDIQAAFSGQFGATLPGEKVREIVRQLDEARFMEGEGIEQVRREVLDAFRSAPVRPAAHAGQSYEADPGRLRVWMDRFFDPPEGPGSPIADGREKALKGIIAPHIDLRRGGPCFAWAYKEVAEASAADLFVVFGTGHSVARGPYALTRKDYDTPFGPVRADRAFIEALAGRCPGADLFEEELGHRTEHSIEFQALFLKYLFPDREVAFVPILCGSFHEAVAARRSPGEGEAVRGFVEALRETIEKDGRRVCMIAGVDFAHVGAKFGDRGPMTPAFLEAVASEDRERLEAIAGLDAEGFFRTVSRDGDRRRICGTSSIYTMLRAMDASEGRLLRYDRTVDPQTDSCVTFASAAFY